MKEILWKDRLRYLFDNILSKGTAAMICLLAVASVILILGISGFVYLVGIAPEAHSFAQIFWMSLLRTLDPGTMGGDTGSWPFLLAMLAVTLGGLGTVSILIGLITTGINEKINNMRKGRSRVIETGHIVILGWTEQLFTVIPELVEANSNQQKSCIVILAAKDKVEMEDELRDKVGHPSRTRIVCRTGDPIVLSDLEIASIHASKAIMILAPDVDDPDTHVIKTILAITNNPKRRPQPYRIIAEIRNSKNIEIARLVGGNEAELVLTGALVARIIAQTCRQSGLSVVYTELLNFGGDEIYFQHESALVGKTFGQALLAYEDSAVIGLYTQGGSVRLNPPMDTVIAACDDVIAISEDDDTICLSGLRDQGIRPDLIRSPQPSEPKPERTLILGWNWRAPAIINELDQYVVLGSEVNVVADLPGGNKEIIDYCAGTLRNQTCNFQLGDTTDRRLLDSLAITTYNHIILLCYSRTMDAQQADARTLMTLLHLRDIADRASHPFSIVSEMLDIRNRDIAEVTRADDFIVSDNIISLLMSQITENKAQNAVFADIFDPEGSEIYLKQAENYVKLDEPVNFYTIIEAARQRGETAIGYRSAVQANDASKSYGVVINPYKSQPITFRQGDRVIVLAEN